MSASVVTVNERLVASQADDGLDAVTMRREFIVALSAADSAGCDISMNADSVPRIGDNWPYVVANRITPKCFRRSSKLLDEKLRTHWLVECEYSNAPTVVSSATPIAEEIIPPWEQPEQYSYDYVQYQDALEVDKDGTPVVNSVGDPFDPMPESPRNNRKITITRTRREFSPSFAATLMDSVNLNNVTINGEVIGAGMARMLRWTASTDVYIHPRTEVKTEIFNEQIEVEIAKYNEENQDTGPFPRGFLLPLVDAGYRYKPTPSDDPVPFRDDDGTIRQSPGFLNANGTELDITAADPHVLHFRQFKSVDWGAASNL